MRKPVTEIGTTGQTANYVYLLHISPFDPEAPFAHRHITQAGEQTALPKLQV